VADADIPWSETAAAPLGLASKLVPDEVRIAGRMGACLLFAAMALAVLVTGALR
jgi:hypothetical protein